MAKKPEINKELLAKWEATHKSEILSVKKLGDKIGYGNMMSIASALWAMNLSEKNYPTDGAFIPTIACNMKVKDAKKALEEQNRRMKIFKKMLENK